MTRQEVDIFSEKNIFNVITAEFGDIFIRNAPNYNLFTFDECFIDENQLNDLQTQNLVNLAVAISSKKTLGRAYTLKNVDNIDVVTNEAYVVADVSFYLFTYNPFEKINSDVRGINNKRDYFYYVDALLRAFLKPRGLAFCNQTSRIFDKKPAIENVYTAKISVSDIIKYNNPDILNFKLSTIKVVDDK